ncbi:MAG: cyclic nucleotide-binding and patatin-like phospholipase domain-containing protein [Candidatus Omnitrophota bacterium]
MDKKETKLIISSSQPFNKLGWRQLHKLIKIGEIKEYKNSEVIYNENSPPDFVYFLLRGRVAVSSCINEKDSQIEILKRGVCFGIISFLTEENHSVTARSIETSYVMLLEKEAFREFLEKNPSLSLDFSCLLSQRVKSRYRPKRIFQSKKIAISGIQGVGKTTYMFDLSRKVKNQTGKNIVAVRILAQGEEFPQDRRLSQSQRQLLSLRDFREDTCLKYVIKGEVDSLCLEAGMHDNFHSLINFLSENYHFVFYEIPIEFLLEHDSGIVGFAHQLHLLAFPSIESLKQANRLIKEQISRKFLTFEKTKVLIRESKDSNIEFTHKRKLLGHPIYATIPALESPDYDKALRRIAREIGEVTLGLALGSGAAYGFAHIGVLKVLEEEGILVDVICGSSMGAIIGAFWAAGFSMADIISFSKEVGRKISKFSIFGFSLPYRGIMKARRLENIFKSIFRDLTFYDLKHTLKIVTFDFRKRKTIILEEGFLYKAVAASCAFPGIFEPISWKKDIFLDGGILNPLPTGVFLNYHIHKIIASNITPLEGQAVDSRDGQDKFHIFDFIFGSIETMQQQFVQQASKIADVVISPDLRGLGWTEFNKVEEFIKRGQEAARKKIGEIKKLAAC